MADNVKKIASNKKEWAYFEKYVRAQGDGDLLDFLSAKLARNEIYDRYLSEVAEIRVDALKPYRLAGEKIWTATYNACVVKGVQSEPARRAAANSPAFEKLLKKARIAAVEKFQTDHYDDYRKSDDFRDFALTKVNGKKIAKALKFPASTADDLALAKIYLIMGEETKAKAPIRRANEEQFTALAAKAKNPRAGIRGPSESDVIDGLKNYKLTVGA
ncbi:hypothetical protein [Rhizobium halophytocola]|uniref:Uncharacterized protein n=1 Tax=Rhizobium halophytocola TaxID=735519 RepID=A0ABS4E5T4_9HYPH|nr:hypothetical protein [Rhizobium halophytocola]MBP1853268.1 hypothetical protein [Rhizobium halophytocola]